MKLWFSDSNSIFTTRAHPTCSNTCMCLIFGLAFCIWDCLLFIFIKVNDLVRLRESY